MQKFNNFTQFMQGVGESCDGNLGILHSESPIRRCFARCHQSIYARGESPNKFTI